MRGYAVVLLEAQRIGWGASGRNGGQAIVGFGSDGELAIEKALSRADAPKAWDISEEGLDLLRERIETPRDRLRLARRLPESFGQAVEVTRASPWMDHVAERHGYPLEWIGARRHRQWVASERFDSGTFDAVLGPSAPAEILPGLARPRGPPAHASTRTRSPPHRTGRTPAGRQDRAGRGALQLRGAGRQRVPGGIRRRRSRRPFAHHARGHLHDRYRAHGRDRADALIRNRPAASDTNFVLDYFRVSADHRLLFGAGDSYSARTPRNLAQKIRKSMLAVFPQLSDLASTTHGAASSTSP
jgi:gamma-glutamylputrescine oxidase